ncbi:MAG: hypothetical protein CVV53_01385 [Spirochaetae bacterium HGW-Spirochaetae-9]|nr:MAG: hypothetical protein CVV53_01385 [Spirochaetae bacterium HGW-Spirochaetae-9]
MKRNHLSIILGMALIALLMGSCDALFENQFGSAGLGQPSDAEIAEQATSSDPAVAQPALALQVESKLDAANATPLIENLVDVLLTQGSNLDTMTTSGSTTMSDILEALVPAETLSTPGALAAAIDAIASTLPNLTTLANSVLANSDDGDAYDAEGLNTQNLAMTAALATIFTSLSPVGSNTSVGDALENYNNAVVAYETNGGSAPDIASFITLTDSSTDFEALFTSGSTVSTLFAAAGVNFDELNG